MASERPADLSQIRWQCRRGMLELDLLLERFVDDKYTALEQSQRDCFGKLLKQSDQLLYEWFTGKQIPYDLAFRQLVEQIRE